MSNIRAVLTFGWPYIRPYWGRLLAGVLLGILFGVSQASFVWATKTLIDRMTPASETALHSTAPAAAEQSAKPVSFSTQVKAKMEQTTESVFGPWLPEFGKKISWRQIVGGLLFLPILVAVRGASSYLSSYCLAWASERVVNDLRIDVLKKLSSLSLDFYNRSTMGDLLTRVSGDTASLQRCLSLGIGDIVKEPATLIGVLIALCVIDWQLTIGAMIFFPLCVLPIIILGRKVRKASKEGLAVNIKQSSLLVETLSGIRVIKAFGLESRQVERFTKQSREAIHHTMKNVSAKEKINPIIETVSMIGLGALILYIIYQQRAISDMVGYLTGLVFFYTPVKKLAGIHVLFQQTSAGVERLMHILQEQPSVKELPNARPLPRFTIAIEFKHASFSYGDGDVLHDVNLKIPHRMKLGIAGESGCGKSTLLNLLFRFYDVTCGSIKIDGHDLRELSLSDVRNNMALVSQEIVLFDQTVAENIACGKIDATQAEIEAAARAAYAHEFILQLPQGYETRLGERGARLSGGQRQRIAIARAFVRDAPILVLDEATAALDSQSEAEVQAAIEKLEQNRTVICVAHRLSTLVRMDRIIVLSAGRVIESGNFKELLQKNGAFAEMARRQGIIQVV